MNTLIETIIKKIPQPVFGVHDLMAIGFRGEASRHGLVKRAVAQGDLIIIKRGLYALAPEYRKTNLNPYYLAQLISGPSYVSLESALSEHGLIPEAVHAITCVHTSQSKNYDTPVAYFAYSRVPQKTLYKGVSRRVDAHGYAWMLADPIKALADYVHIYRKNWTSSQELTDFLRIEIEDIRSLPREDFEVLFDNYSNRRVQAFLQGLYREIFL